MDSSLFSEPGSCYILSSEEASPLQCLSDLRQLEVLKLSFQALSVVPMHISKIASLKDLDVSHNPILEAVALEISTLEHLTCEYQPFCFCNVNCLSSS